MAMGIISFRLRIIDAAGFSNRLTAPSMSSYAWTIYR